MYLERECRKVSKLEVAETPPSLSNANAGDRESLSVESDTTSRDR